MFDLPKKDDIIPLSNDKFLDELVERARKATEGFTKNGEITITAWEADQFNLATKTAALVIRTNMMVFGNVNDDESVTISLIKM